MTKLERIVIDKCLEGTHPILVELRAQASKLKVVERVWTGVGFFTEFVLPEDAAKVRLPGQHRIGDVFAEIEGLEYGAGFVLFIVDGQITLLEGHSYEEPWPPGARLINLSHINNRRDITFLD